ncbi:hypothetical protein VC83_01000 [Pseudogymnoascus destructans]|uniref:Coenzyme Q-binding protein COQ10 START domain-containing protein n=2 Tax=Pseudogymnoascus destructans TaxID=655981 RepID=L8FMJ5_PSED2|nr:uncharacterized protein VC83_01000 [Pseudogymnoascus destructans]ELR01769.1 hypothetical protein GMDG_00145 [Pseudogymnoascus destructans 20631-21]OAF62506.1 hypothetical protein VC83_01000 [Pseudogymnoascus destructans]
MSSTFQPGFARPLLPALPEGKTSALVRAPVPTPTFPDESTLSFTVHARIHIAAPPIIVLRALLDTGSWPRWNSFIPAVQIYYGGTPVSALPESSDILGVGAVFTMFVNMSGKSEEKREPVEKLRKSNEYLSIVEELVPQREQGRKGWRMAWGADGHFMLKGDRVQEIVETEGGCEYVTWESFGGMMAPVVRLAVGGQLIDRFADQARDLKEWCEGDGGE